MHNNDNGHKGGGALMCKQRCISYLPSCPAKIILCVRCADDDAVMLQHFSCRLSVCGGVCGADAGGLCYGEL